MSICPPRPDTHRRCFAPCPSGTFCKCKGRVIAKDDPDALAELFAEFEEDEAPKIGAYDEEMKAHRHIERKSGQ